METFRLDAKELLDSYSRVAAQAVESGMEIERRKTQAVLVAYDKALKDPQTKLPTYLMLCLEALR